MLLDVVLLRRQRIADGSMRTREGAERQVTPLLWIRARLGVVGDRLDGGGNYVYAGLRRINTRYVWI